MLYRWIVQRILRTAYARHNQGDQAPVLRSLAEKFHYEYHGDSPLAGVRTSKAEMKEFLTGLTIRMPGHRFEAEDIAVHGPPWRTTVIVWLTLTVPLPGRPAMRSIVAQRARMRWGKITRLETLSDSKKVDEAFAALGR
jgi:ketosteroid isomerase-like protein